MVKSDRLLVKYKYHFRDQAFFVKPVLRICDILVRIGITDPAFFVSVNDKVPTKKLVFFHRFLVYYFLKVHLHQSSKIKSHKILILDIFYLFCLLMEGSGSVQIMIGPNPGGPKNMRIRRIRKTTLI
jgi:hypothetical protein